MAHRSISTLTEGFRDLPSVDRLLAEDKIQHLISTNSRGSVLYLIRDELSEIRDTLKRGGRPPNLDELIQLIEDRAELEWQNWPTSVINGTGVILHTNLGRAPLSEDALAAIQETGAYYSDLEFDLATGRRGPRQAHVSRLICQITGSEAAIVVNNNASAVMLGLAAIATGTQVIVSRSEAVEIGGGFRIPDVLRQSGAELIEVGTTNRTYGHDYEEAITESTGGILAVHSSNFKISGFTHFPELKELVEIGRRYRIPVLHDLGSGCLLETTHYGLEHEPMPQESMDAGVSLAFFSGDKLLGGPQAGIISGTTELIEQISKHPLARAARLDKLNMAALSATLLHYIRNEAEQKIPVWRMISSTPEGLESRVNGWVMSLGEEYELRKGYSTIGGGSLPGEVLPTTLLAIDGHKFGGPDALSNQLRAGNPPVIGRIDEDKVLLDPRTVLPEQDEDLMRAIRHCLN